MSNADKKPVVLQRGHFIPYSKGFEQLSFTELSLKKDPLMKHLNMSLPDDPRAWRNLFVIFACRYKIHPKITSRYVGLTTEYIPQLAKKLEQRVTDDPATALIDVVTYTPVKNKAVEAIVKIQAANPSLSRFELDAALHQQGLLRSVRQNNRNINAASLLAKIGGNNVKPNDPKQNQRRVEGVSFFLSKLPNADDETVLHIAYAQTGSTLGCLTNHRHVTPIGTDAYCECRTNSPEERMNALIFVTKSGIFHYALSAKSFDAKSFVNQLKVVLRKVNADFEKVKTLVLWGDQYHTHTGNQVTGAFVDSCNRAYEKNLVSNNHGFAIKSYFLPAYSPDLNATEYYNRSIKVLMNKLMHSMKKRGTNLETQAGMRKLMKAAILKVMDVGLPGPRIWENVIAYADYIILAEGNLIKAVTIRAAEREQRSKKGKKNNKVLWWTNPK